MLIVGSGCPRSETINCRWMAAQWSWNLWSQAGSTGAFLSPPTTSVQAVHLVGLRRSLVSGTYTGGGSVTVDLAWTASSGTVNGYYVLRSQGAPLATNCASSYQLLGSTPTPAFEDLNAGIGITQYYRVYAFNGTGHSGVSAEVSYFLPANEVSVEASYLFDLSLTIRAISGGENDATRIQYTLPRAGLASIAIYDLQGRIVRELLKRTMDAGPQEIRWDRRDSVGELVSSGIYFARISSGDESAVGKVTVVR
jgi:hypothetical protein